MPSTTTNYALHTYNATTDKLETFASFRDAIAGVGTNSNMYIIDGKLKEWKDLIDAANAKLGVIRVPMVKDGGGHYSGTGIVGISIAYTVGMTIIAIPDTTNDGTTQLNINSLGNLTMVKVDSAGASANLAVGDLSIGRDYLFVYNGSNLVWVGGTTADQIYIAGTVGDFVKINTDNTFVDSGLALDIDGTLAADSDVKIPSQKAVKTYNDTSLTNLTTLSKSVAFTGDISPTIIGANQDNYNPTGLSTASTLRLSSSASYNVTGLSGGSDGRIIIIANIGSFNIVLINESVSSTAGNRFVFANAVDTTLLPNQEVILQYDSTSSRWRLLGGTALTKAVYTDVATGTDDAKYVTALAIKNSLNVPNVAPTATRNLLTTSDGANWSSRKLTAAQLSDAVAPGTNGYVMTAAGGAWTSAPAAGGGDILAAQVFS